MKRIIQIFILSFMASSVCLAVTPVRNDYYSVRLSVARTKDRANMSYLADRKFFWYEPTLNDILFDRQMRLSLRQDYEDQNRDYEMREKYRLVDRERQRQHFSAMNRFSEDVMNQIRDRQKDIHMNMVKDFVKRDHNLRKLKNPAAFLGLMYGLYRGEELELPVSSTFRLRAYTKALERRGGLKIFNPIVNTSFDMMARAPQKRDAFEPITAESDYQPGQERYRLNIWRSIPALNMSSSFAYAFTTDTANAGISKPIVANLTANLDGSRVMRTNFKTAPQNEGRVSVNYGVSF